MLKLLLKFTSIKNEDVCAYLLRQSIAAIDEVNLKIEEVIDTLVDLEEGSEDFKTVHKVLIDELDKLTKR